MPSKTKDYKIEIKNPKKSNVKFIIKTMKVNWEGILTVEFSEPILIPKHWRRKT